MQCLKIIKGFTLLEVLVALTIIAISLGALITTSGSQARNASYLKQKTIGHIVAMNEITKLHINKSWLGTGTKTGDTEMVGQKWYWVRMVEKTTDDNARKVTLDIYTDEAHKKNVTQLIGYLAKPETTASTGT